MRRTLHSLACLSALALLASCSLFGGGRPSDGFRARVVLSSTVPDPAEAAYADCLIHLQFRAETSGEGVEEGDTFVGVMWAFRDRELTEAAWLRPGDIITAKLVAFDDADPKIHRIMRVDNTDDFLSPLLWVESWEGIELSEKSKRGLRAEGRFNPYVNIGSAARRERLIEVFRSHGGRPFGGVDRNFLFKDYAFLYENEWWIDSGQGPRGTSVPPFDSIMGFKRELDALGIQLIVLFPPSTASVFPDYGTNEAWSFEDDGRVDVHLANFFDQLRAAGVSLVDPFKEFVANRFETGPDGREYPIFVFHDQHWSPLGAQIAAHQVSAKLKSAPWFRDSSILRTDPALVLEKTTEIKKVRDVMLARAKKDGTVDVVAHQNIHTSANSAIFDPNSSDAVVHLIGDSFTTFHSKIQSSFAEHLAADLKMPVRVFFTLGSASTTAVTEWIRTADKRNLKAVVWQVHPGYLSQRGAWKNISIGGEDVIRLIDVFDRAGARSPLVRAAWADGVMAGYQTSILADFPQSESSAGDEPFRIVWDKLSLGDQPVFRTQVANGAMNWVETDGIDFQVLINGAMIASRPSMRTWQDWRVDLSPFAGQTVQFELRADPRTGTQGDQPRWGNPEIWDARFE